MRLVDPQVSGCWLGDDGARLLAEAVLGAVERRFDAEAAPLPLVSLKLARCGAADAAAAALSRALDAHAAHCDNTTGGVAPPKPRLTLGAADLAVGPIARRVAPGRDALLNSTAEFVGEGRVLARTRLRFVPH